MKLILKETISTLGQEGSVVTVKPGYGRNYLLPQGKAVLATKDNLATLEQNKAEIAARLAEQKKQAEALSKKISGVEIVIEQLAGAPNEGLAGAVLLRAGRLADHHPVCIGITDAEDGLGASGMQGAARAGCDLLPQRFEVRDAPD